MMEKLQYDSFYKFLVSIGLILFVAPLFCLYYIVSGSYDILLSKNELNDLSSMSLDLINIKINSIKVIYHYLPYACALLVIIGLICIIIGCKKWYYIQKRLDELTELDLKEKQLNIQNMTPSEIISKVLKDETENSEENIQELTNYSSTSSRIMKAFEIENAAYDYITRKFKHKYLVRQNVKIMNYEFDIVASSIYDNIDLIYEIKYWRGAVSQASIFRTIKRLKDSINAYETHAERNCRCVLMIVSPSNEISKEIREQLEKINQLQNNSNIKIEYIEEKLLFKQ